MTAPANTPSPTARSAPAAAPLRVLFVTSECAPWAKTGGLGDVSAALPKALAAAGHDVRVLMPAYSGLQKLLRDEGGPFVLPTGGGWPAARLACAARPSFELWLLDCPALYDRFGGTPYADAHGHDHADNARRFAFLSWVAASLCAPGGAWPDWRADVLHANDWPTGLAAGYLSLAGAPRPACVFTIHNLAFQGMFAAELAAELALPDDWLDVEGVLHWGRISMLKAGLRHADAITTVSPTYAREIQTEAFGFGMDGMMRLRAGALRGILNGVDTEQWDPQTDGLIAQPYRAGQWAAKAVNKAALQRRLGLPVAAGTLLFGVVSRLSDQKGIDLVLDSLGWLRDAGCQLAVLGAGDPQLERRLAAAAAADPAHVAARIGFDEELAHLIEAGADCFLMPSRFEPCGLNQLYSLAYGTPPLVHATGGLADTVRDTANGGNGTGFVMNEATLAELQRVLGQVQRAYADHAGWRRLLRRTMAERFTWAESAAGYVRVYRDAIAALGAHDAAPPEPRQ